MKFTHKWAVAAFSIIVLGLTWIADRGGSIRTGYISKMPGYEPAAPAVRAVGESALANAGIEFEKFAEWAASYRQAATGIERSALEAEGVELARMRRAAMVGLIRTDPERALKMAAPASVRRNLPPAVGALLEKRVSARGDLMVLAALAEPGKEQEVEPVWRIAKVDNEDYRAFVYGRRLGEPSRRNIPLSAIELDQLMAVQENPVRVLPADEAEPFLARAEEADCEISKEPAAAKGQPVTLEVGGEVRFVCSPGHAAALNEELIAAEGGAPGDPAGGGVQASAWTEGAKKVILIRVDFPDLTGLSLTDVGGATLMTSLNSFYSEMSYGRAGFTAIGAGSDVTPIFRMANIASYYGSNNYYDQLRAEARAAATAAGYNLSNYNLDVICMGPVPGFGWSGLAYVGSAGAWLRNSFGTGVAGHELGHNFGLNHAGFWDTAGASIIGPGTAVEYGDSFDTMGSASAGNNHFNARFKNYLNWLQSSETSAATASGTYRIYAHDQPLTSGSRGLRIVKDSTTNYWVEFRQKFTGNPGLMNGAGIRWTGNGSERSRLLDTTPGSVGARNDSALVIGRTFADPAAGIYITPIGKGGTTPESLDVVVNLGGFAGNVAPVMSVTSSGTTAATGTLINFQAPSTDANGDTLVYYWDFGDGSFGTNSLNASKTWSTAGQYVVRCTVTDMKGGETSDSVVVTIGSPSTFAISGIVTDGSGPIQNARIYVSTTRVAYSDSDGTYSIVGLPAGTYTVNASLYPHTFLPDGFSNPVNVGPDAANINFLSTIVLPPAITAQPQSQSVNAGTSATFAVAVTGTQPMNYQWRFNGSNISGASGATYTRNNVQAADTGNYSAVISNPAGSVTTANAVLTLNAPPVITAQPLSRNVLAGANVTFSVTAGGSGPLTYQWRFNSSDIPGAASATYTRVGVQPADAGNYSVVVANSFGSVTSTSASLSVNYSLSVNSTPGGKVTVQPVQPYYAPNSVVTLTAESLSVYEFSGWSGGASGTVNPLAVVITSNLNITAVFTSPVADIIVDNPAATFTGNWATAATAADKYGNNYRTVGGSVNSASASATFSPNILTAGRYDLHVWSPTLTKPAAGLPVVVTGSGVQQTVSLNQAAGPGTWQLLASGVPFGAGSAGFVRLANNVGQGGKTVAADAVRWTYSPTQEETPPQFISQPQSLTVNQGDEAVFTAQSSGTGPLFYQWRFNNTDIPGATDATLVLAGAQPSQEGQYSVVVRNALGSITSDNTALIVLGSPLITAEPVSLAVGVGEDADFSVTVKGVAPLAYQWRKDGADLADNSQISGSTSPVLTISGSVPGNAGVYTVVVSNSLGTVTSSMASLSVLGPPVLTAEPLSLAVPVGASAVFSAAAEGPGPLTYQWRRENVDLVDNAQISGATSPVLTITGVDRPNAGAYTVVVSNPYGTVTSSIASLTVLGPPVLTAEPLSLAVPVGTSAVFSVAAEGPGPLTYQWRRGEVAVVDDAQISGSTSPVLTITGAEPRHAGAYTVVVSNPYGAVTSSMALLSVGFEADTVPGPYGDNLITAGDQEFIGSVLTGMTEPGATLAFSQLDSAPRSSLGDGVISLIDWVQAGRYVAALDPPTPAGGPASATSATAGSTPPQMDPLTTLRVVGNPLQRGQDTEVIIELVSQGDVNAVAFTLNFDPSVLTYRSLEWIDGAAIPSRIVNSTEVTDGQLAVVAGAPAGTAFPAGSRQLLRLSFAVAASSAATETVVGFADRPVSGEVASASATELPAEFESAVLTIIADTTPEFQSMEITANGEVELTLTGSLPPGYAVKASADMIEWTPLPLVTGGSGATVRVIDAGAPGARRRFYRVGLTGD